MFHDEGACSRAPHPGDSKIPGSVLIMALVQTLCHKRSNSFLDKKRVTKRTDRSNSFFVVVRIIWSGFYSCSNWFYSCSNSFNSYPPGGKNYGGNSFLEGGNSFYSCSKNYGNFREKTW